MSQLLDVAVDTKVKLCALWTSAMFYSVYSELNRLYIPGALERMRALGADPGIQTAWWVLIGTPIVMIFLSVALPAKYNRSLNIVIGGLVFLAIALTKLAAVVMLSKQGGPTSSALAVRQIAVSVDVAIAVFAALVVWYAWKWPKTSNANH